MENFGHKKESKTEVIKRQMSMRKSMLISGQSFQLPGWWHSRFFQIASPESNRQPLKPFIPRLDLQIIMYSQNLFKQQFMTLHNQTSNGMPTNQDQYISQFLVFESEENKEKGATVQEPVEQMRDQDADGPQDEIYSESTPADDSSSVSHKAKRSPLHNFQKHFVTTIRRSVRLRWPDEPEGFLLLAKEMWEIFKNSRKYTKEFVSLILGQSEHHVDEQLLKKYGLLECTSKFSESDYHKAQAYLKSKVLETFKSIPKEKIMYERRIGKKEEFANYFFKVLAEIEEGVMNKRLPKRKRGGRRNSYPKFKKEIIEAPVQGSCESS